MTSAELSEVKNLIKRANSVLVVLDAESDFDQQLAAASLFLYLKNLEQELTVNLVSPQSINNHTISGLNELKTEMGKNNLVISFDYEESAVGNVSYNIDEQARKFYLTIKPKKGQEPLSQDSVEFDYVGADADLVFLVGVKDLENLKQLYFGYEELYEQAALVDISSHALKQAQFYQSPNEFCCTSEAVLAMLEEWGVDLSSEQATNLYAGIQYSSDNFVSLQTSAQTFERLARLLRAGARRSGRTLQRVKQQVASSKSGVKLAKKSSVKKKDENGKKEQQVFKQRPSGLKK